jgi:hypothetical protein
MEKELLRQRDGAYKRTIKERREINKMLLPDLLV